MGPNLVNLSTKNCNEKQQAKNNGKRKLSITTKQGRNNRLKACAGRSRAIYPRGISIA
jgi:hypothetical protein